MADRTSGPSFAGAAKPFARQIIRFRNLVSQGLAEAGTAPAAAAHLSDYYIEIGEDQMIIRRPEKPGHIFVGDETLTQLVDKIDGQPVDLVFVGNSCIDLKFKLPVGLISEMRPIIENEIQFRSPFNEDAALSFYVAEELPDKSWQARAAVTLRKPVEDLIGKLKDRGIALGVARREGENKRITARPDWMHPGVARKATLRNLPVSLKLALLGGIVFCGSALALTVQQGVASNDLAERATVARAQLGEQARANEGNRAVADAMARGTQKLALTGTLSGLLPDGVWLEQLVIEDETVTMIGFAPSAADVTRLLTTLPYLTDIHFASPVTRDNTQSLERFRIAATLGEGAG
ncbi:PilN domain-containing protein [Yoonia sp. 2307UL14-13]|uniref:PilN domain-containing protein n=1 Tax=Yoonia sp. 2307UL14-13 TaxID=3126506 RepID=UPI0030B19E8A